MARHDIRGLKLSDGTYVFSSKDVYNLNDNFIQLSQEVFGNSSFTKKIEKQVLKNVKDIEEITYRVSDAEGNVSTLQNTATSLTNRISNTEGNVSTLQNTATGLTNRVSNAEGDIFALETTAQGLALDIAAADGRALNAQATADAVTLSFNNQIVGGRNLLNNGNFVNDSLAFWSNWGICSRSFIEISGKRWLWLSDNSSNANRGLMQYVQGMPHGQKITISFTARSRWNETSYLDILLHTLGDGSNDPQPSQTFTLTLEEKRYSFTFTASDILAKTGFSFMIGRKAAGYFSALIRDIMFQVGDKATQFFPKEGEFSTTTHTFDGTGYNLKDSNGSALITPNGVANEQNIGRVDNVEGGFPMKIPFHIGSEVSQVTQAVLKWDISKFRTYSKGAASGGGTKTTPSGGAGTTGTRWGATGIAIGTSGTTASTGLPHNHTVSLDDLAHSHSTPAHTHSLDITHEHAPVYGILEQNIVDYVFTVWVDGALRATLNAQRGEVDLSAWITTSGWHEIRLQVNNLMRIDANLFLKTYIRR